MRIIISLYIVTIISLLFLENLKTKFWYCIGIEVFKAYMKHKITNSYLTSTL